MTRGNGREYPRILGLFQKRIDGDDSLLQLAGLRFGQAGMGAEFYAETLQELEHLLTYKPHPETPAIVHLRRGLKVFESKDGETILDFARHTKGRIFGIVLHDQTELASDSEAYREALRGINSRLAPDGPGLFIEYASGLDVEEYTNFMRSIRDLERISACIDTGHVGIWKIRSVFSRVHPCMDVCSLRPDDPGLPGLLEDVRTAVDSALPSVLRVVRELAALNKPLHFHLHDGHPLFAGPYGVSDHMSFFGMIALPFEFRGRKSLDLMYGIPGMMSIVSESVGRLTADKVSFSLEIHPSNGRIPLGDASYLFDHWHEKGNAEQMNFWLDTLIQNFLIVKEACRINDYVLQR